MLQHKLLRILLAGGLTLISAPIHPTPPLAATQTSAPTCSARGAGAYPILFVTQTPHPQDFTTVVATFGNQEASIYAAPRGGDLWLCYPSGTLKNITQAAGYGIASGLQVGSNAIAVRDPSPHWSGNKAVFSMVTGAPTQYQTPSYYWRIYEVSGLGENDTPVISLLPNQPANVNNIYPIYGSDDRVLFVSDVPRTGSRAGAEHLYPQRDEYELAPTNTGIWSLNPSSGDLFLLDHAPSGDFAPIVDSFGRVIFTRWDHLQRDQQADGEIVGSNCYSRAYGTFNYSNESASATYNLQTPDRTEVYPEPRTCRNDLLANTNLEGHQFNQFFPWMVNQDGTELETLNHLGRHEFMEYIPRSIKDDANVIDYYQQYARYNANGVDSIMQVKEDPLQPGRYYGIDASEFGTHASGQIISFTAAPANNADATGITYVTHRDTAGSSDTPSANHSGLHREPTPLSDGTLLASHTFNTRQDSNIGSSAAPLSRYTFRLRLLSKTTAYWTPTLTLTTGISKTMTWWSPDSLLSFSGNLWEINPVELRPRPVPPLPSEQLQSPELQMFSQAGVSPSQLKKYLQQKNLALIVSRNVTSRDDQDKQQPYNLRVNDVGGTQTIGASGTLYDVEYMQIFQADQLRGWTGGYSNTPYAGRRVLARPLHDTNAVNANLPPQSQNSPVGSVVIAPDGSQAAFVPARRALTWQLTDDTGNGIVRERYWLTFQPGEVRVCASCHGLNVNDQAGKTAPTNPPQALYDLLTYWKTNNPPVSPRAFIPNTRRAGPSGW